MQPVSSRRSALGFWLWTVVAVVVGVGVTDVSFWMSEPASNGSVVEYGAATLNRAMGIPERVLEGPLPVEGSDWNVTDGTVVLGTGGSLEVALDEPVEVQALSIQATRNARYEVEASVDGESWTPIWSVPIRSGAKGLVSDHLVLDEPVSLRLLRVRSSASVAVAVLGGVRAYAELPDEWPITGPARAETVSSYPWLELETIYLGKLVVAACGAALFVASWWLRRRPDVDAVLVRRIDRALVITAVVAGLGWYNWMQFSGGVWERTHFNYWDATHYYLGSKYAPELKYDGLYHCILVADAEDGLSAVRLTQPGVRDLASNRGRRVHTVIADKSGCTDRFSAERWEAFRRDVAHLRAKLPPMVQLKLLQDHGYNPTPVWTLAGRALGALGPADPLRMRIAFAVDPVLLALSFAFIAATFGVRVMCFSLILFGTSFAFGNWFTAGAVIRFGWFVSAVAGICLLKRERWALAGAVLALSTLLRLFPVFLVGGVALGALVRMALERRTLPDAPTLRFAGGVAAAALALAVVSLPAAGGPNAWFAFLENTQKHTATAGAQNLGFDALILPLFDDPSGKPADYRRADHRRMRVSGTGAHKAIRSIVGLASFALLVWAVRREPPWVCALLGLAWMPFVLDVTNYYWSVAVLFGPLCLRSPVLLLPFALLAVVWAAVGVSFDYEGFAMYQVASAMLLVFAGTALSWFAFRAPGIEVGPPQ